MLKNIWILSLTGIAILTGGCATSYKAQPLPMRTPASYANALVVEDVTVAAEAFVESERAQEAFGYNVRGAGLLPVQVVFENRGPHSFRINPGQTFLEDEKGNLWPILDERTAYERATRYSQTQKIFSEGAYSGFLGATAGAVIGAAIGIVTGEGVGEALGKGAAVGAAAGAVIGGAKGAGESQEARRTIINDLNRKSLENKDIAGGLAYGVLFFPAEAESAGALRLRLAETGSGRAYDLRLALGLVGNGASSVLRVYPAAGGVSAPPAARLPGAAQPAEPDMSAVPPEPAPGSGGSTCREWQLIEKRTVYRTDPATGKTIEVPTEKWDWVEVPCGGNETGSAGPGAALPSEYVFSAPPSVAVIPGTYAYVVPDAEVDIVFYHGHWYRPYRGYWYRSISYNGPWGYLAPAKVPRVVITLPAGYRRLAHDHYRIPYSRLHANWHRWEKSRYWHGDERWRKHSSRGRRH